MQQYTEIDPCIQQQSLASTELRPISEALVVLFILAALCIEGTVSIAKILRRRIMSPKKRAYRAAAANTRKNTEGATTKIDPALLGRGGRRTSGDGGACTGIPTSMMLSSSQHSEEEKQGLSALKAWEQKKQREAKRSAGIDAVRAWGQDQERIDGRKSGVRTIQAWEQTQSARSTEHGGKEWKPSSNCGSRSNSVM